MQFDTSPENVRYVIHHVPGPAWRSDRAPTEQEGISDHSAYLKALDVLSKEPLAPLMRAQDTELVQVVRLTIFTMIEAEELGITSENIDSPRPAHRPVRAPHSLRTGCERLFREWVTTVRCSIETLAPVVPSNSNEG